MYDDWLQIWDLKSDSTGGGDDQICASYRNWNSAGGTGVRNTSVEMDHQAGIRREANQSADRARPKVLMHNGKIMMAKTTPETVSAHWVPDAAPPFNRACASAGSPKIFDERAGWAEKPSVHMVLGRIKPSGKGGDDPGDATAFGLCSTQQMQNCCGHYQ